MADTQSDQNIQVVHGTNGGYRQHLKSRTRACLACSDANARYQRARKILTGKVTTANLPITTVAALLEPGVDVPALLAEALTGEVLDAIEIRVAQLKGQADA
ncbi:hypothetical protein GCM10010174_69810 [Kutzneria viridogrisea]|uniref:Uncharacterized protein n=1 Tax=Kutzneria viridogrisea TaxID=47990 RepID=A0ABR6BAY7_9PSEU|nr:hypothetical protein [Kutzneria viridogrisea]